MIRILIDYTFYFIGEGRVQNSEKYLTTGADQEIIPYNKDFTDQTFVYFKNLYTALSFVRVIIFLVSIKYLKAMKVMAYYHLFMEFIFELGLPINRGTESPGYVHLMTTLWFCLDYFHFWPTAICCGIVQLTNGVA